jgi:hypothetical protein
MNMPYRSRSRRDILRVGVALVLSSLAGPAGAQGPPASVSAPAAPAPPAVLTATTEAPGTMLLDRPTATGSTLLDINVRAFTPPPSGAVGAVVSLEENKEGGREVEVGGFTIFPAKRFEATKAEDERGFRLNATQALAELGAGGGPVKIKVKLVSLRQGESVEHAELVLGSAQFVSRAESTAEPK